jgi:hypothetical protein
MGANVSKSSVFVFAASAAFLTLLKKVSAADTCVADLQNSAFVFIKPQANTKATQNLVRTKLKEAGISITSEGDIDGTVIDKKKLIDQHYYAIGTYCSSV